MLLNLLVQFREFFYPENKFIKVLHLGLLNLKWLNNGMLSNH